MVVIPSRNAFNSCHTTLKTSLTSGTQTSNIVLNAMVRNGATVSAPFTAGGIFRFYRGNLEEHIYCTSASVDATTKDITLGGTVIRDLPWNDGTSFTTAGAGIAWPAGTFVDLVLDARHMNEIAFRTLANTWSAVQTMATGASITPTNTTTPVYHGQVLTTAQRDALTGVTNGDWIYNSTAGQTQWREGGSWVSNAAGGSLSDAANGTAGKVDLATAAEVAAGTATDASSGASNVIPVAITALTGAGAGDSGKIPALGTGGAVDETLGGTGNVTYTKGDLLAASGAAVLAKLAVGANNTVLTAASGEATGIKWGTPMSITVEKLTCQTASASYTTTSTSDVEVDATNTKVTIASVGANDTIVVIVAGVAGTGNAANTVGITLYGGGSNLAGAASNNFVQAKNADRHNISFTHVLQPGAQSNYVISLYWRVDGDTGTLRRGTDGSALTFAVLRISPAA